MAGVRLLGLTIVVAAAMFLIWMSPRILAEGHGDTGKAVLVATVAVFSIAAKDLTEGLKRDITEFITSLRQQRRPGDIGDVQEKEDA